MPGSRVYIEIPASQRALLTDAMKIAGARGEVLADFMHPTIVAAALAAEAGRADLLPPKPKPQRVRREPHEPPRKGTPLRYTAAEGEWDRCKTAITEAGSSPVAVALAALQAYIDADGIRMDVEVPWVPRVRPVAGRDRAARTSPLQRAGAA